MAPVTCEHVGGSTERSWGDILKASSLMRKMEPGTSALEFLALGVLVNV